MFSSFKTSELRELERFVWTWFKPTGVHEPLAAGSHSIKGFRETDGIRHNTTVLDAAVPALTP